MTTNILRQRMARASGVRLADTGQTAAAALDEVARLYVELELRRSGESPELLAVNGSNLADFLRKEIEAAKSSDTKPQVSEDVGMALALKDGVSGQRLAAARRISERRGITLSDAWKFLP
ncbi:MAG: hypothetical protein SFV23_17570 [Planctomycetaceae bacterium]|nr:hypothetical protein [Planctomycetaceae bacterium]